MPVRETVKKKKKGTLRQTRGHLGYRQCDDTGYHAPHNVTDEEYPLAYWSCRGKLNGREGYLFIDAKIKTPYIKAPGGKMVHLLGEGSYFHWYPNQYGDGFGHLTCSTDEPWGRFPPHLHVKVLCKHPSWLRDPMLLWEIPDGLITNDGTPITLCKYCEAVKNA